LVLGGFAHKNSSASPVANQAKVRLEAVSSSNDLGRGDGFQLKQGNKSDKIDEYRTISAGVRAPFDNMVMSSLVYTGLRSWRPVSFTS